MGSSCGTGSRAAANSRAGRQTYCLPVLIIRSKAQPSPGAALEAWAAPKAAPRSTRAASHTLLGLAMVLSGRRMLQERLNSSRTVLQGKLAAMACGAGVPSRLRCPRTSAPNAVAGACPRNVPPSFSSQASPNLLPAAAHCRNAPFLLHWIGCQGHMPRFQPAPCRSGTL